MGISCQSSFACNFHLKASLPASSMPKFFGFASSLAFFIILFAKGLF